MRLAILLSVLALLAGCTGLQVARTAVDAVASDTAGTVPIEQYALDAQARRDHAAREQTMQHRERCKNMGGTLEFCYERFPVEPRPADPRPVRPIVVQQQQQGAAPPQRRAAGGGAGPPAPDPAGGEAEMDAMYGAIGCERRAWGWECPPSGVAAGGKDPQR